MVLRKSLSQPNVMRYDINEFSMSKECV